MSDILVVDVQSMPVEFVDFKRAAKYMVKHKVNVLSTDPSRIVRSPHFEFEMPFVIQLKNKAALRRRRSVPLTQKNLLIRDNGICQYCGKDLVVRRKGLEFSEVSKDHVFPRSLGGKTEWTNIVLACIPCNKKKANRTLVQCGMQLLKVPTMPSIYDARFNFRLHIKKLLPEWKPWESWLYWNVELDK